MDYFNSFVDLVGKEFKMLWSFYSIKIKFRKFLLIIKRNKDDGNFVMLFYRKVNFFNEYLYLVYIYVNVEFLLLGFYEILIVVVFVLR